MNRLDHLWAESIQKELDDGRCLAARALVLRIQSLRLFTLRASIAIALFAAGYFAAQLVRGAL
jgi:hypothetical protein